MNRFQMSDRIDELEKEVEALRASSAESSTALASTLEHWDRSNARYQSSLDRMYRMVELVKEAVMELEEAGAQQLPLYNKLKRAADDAPYLLPKVREHASIKTELFHCSQELGRMQVSEEGAKVIAECRGVLDRRAKFHNKLRSNLLNHQREMNQQRRKKNRA